MLASPDTPRSRYQPEGTPFDGFLFPATYRVEDPDRGNEQKLIDQMVKQFDTVGHEIGLDNAPAMLEGQAGNREITPYDAVIVASLIEGEANQPEERAKVARVIYNRLEQDMTLGLDATVLVRAGRAQGTSSPSPTSTSTRRSTPASTGGCRRRRSTRRARTRWWPP